MVDNKSEIDIRTVQINKTYKFLPMVSYFRCVGISSDYVNLMDTDGEREEWPIEMFLKYFVEVDEDGNEI